MMLENNPYKGKHHTIEIRQKIKDNHGGRGRATHNAIKIIYKGVQYRSLAEASRETNISTYHIKKSEGR